MVDDRGTGCGPLREAARRPTTAAVAALLLLASAAPGATPSPTAPRLPVRRVVLYNNGVAFVERRGSVTGDVELPLCFRPSQVDDVLKSLLVLDLGHGAVSGVSYASSAPPQGRLGEIPFAFPPVSSGDEGAAGLAEVLRQLQGARVSVATTGGRVAGDVLTVERRRVEAGADGRATTRAFVVLAGLAGEVSSLDLDGVRSVRVQDAEARRDLGDFARATAAARRRDARTLVVASRGRGARELVVSYTLAAPVWKASYRIALEPAGRPLVQGWAIVDNVGEEDWRGVRLSLVSGSPVSFVQHLQQPLYRHRPVLPLADGLRAEPQRIATTAAELLPEPGFDLGVEGGIAGGVAGGVPGGVVGGALGGLPDEPPTSDRPELGLSEALAADATGVTAATRPVETGDFVEYRAERPVTILRDRTALIPFLQDRLDGERVSLYGDRDRRDERPMAALRLQNSSRLTLEPGPVTVLDGDVYAGEGQLTRLKPGEERLVPYAVDLSTRVETATRQGRAPAFLVRVRGGVFEAHFHRTRTTTYTATNQADRPRVLYVDKSRGPTWELAPGGPTPSDERPEAWRFRVELPPHGRIELPVVERLALVERYVLSRLSEANLRTFEEQGLLDGTARAALARVRGLQVLAESLEERTAAAGREIEEITVDQGRLRENVKAMGGRREAHGLLGRWLERAAEQEARLEALRGERRRLGEERARARAEIEQVVRRLEGERRL